MESMRQRSIVVAMVIAVILVGAVATSAVLANASNRGQGTKLDLYAAQTDFRPASFPTSPGDQNYIGWDLYALDDSGTVPAPQGDPIGRELGVCTLVTPSEGVCDGLLELDGRGTLTLYLEVNLASGSQASAITGGTGEFAGAGGTMAETIVPGNPNDRVNHIELTGRSQP